MADKRVIVRYHYEDGSWWAESPDLPALFAGGDTLEDARDLVRQVVHSEIGEDATIFAFMPMPEPLREMVHPFRNSTEGETASVEPFMWSSPSPRRGFEFLGNDPDQEKTCGAVVVH